MILFRVLHVNISWLRKWGLLLRSLLHCCQCKNILQLLYFCTLLPFRVTVFTVAIAGSEWQLDAGLLRTRYRTGSTGEGDVIDGYVPHLSTHRGLQNHLVHVLQCHMELHLLPFLPLISMFLPDLRNRWRVKSGWRGTSAARQCT